MLTRMRPSSNRYHVATVFGAPSGVTVPITAGFGLASSSRSSCGSGDVGMVERSTRCEDGHDVASGEPTPTGATAPACWPRRAPARTSRRAGAPGGCPRRGCRPRRARRPGRSTRRSSPLRLRYRARRPPGPRSSSRWRPEAVSSVRPAKPRTLWRGSGSRQRSTSWRLPWALPDSDPLRGMSFDGCQPRREASQPTSSSAAAADSGLWRTVTALMWRRSGRRCAGSKVAATRSRHGVERSHARSTT